MKQSPKYHEKCENIPAFCGRKHDFWPPSRARCVFFPVNFSKFLCNRLRHWAREDFFRSLTSCMRLASKRETKKKPALSGHFFWSKIVRVRGGGGSENLKKPECPRALILKAPLVRDHFGVRLAYLCRTLWSLPGPYSTRSTGRH